MNEINEKLIQENRTDRNEEPFIKEKAQKAPYMGYAYAKKIEKPQLMFGNSPEDILKTLNQWNQGRKEGYTYDTCNIGAYNPELDKYENYSKYDVQTGKNVTKIYLQVPKGMSKEEFDQTRQYLKENGARFSNLKKQWYITPDIRDKFEKYLEVSEDKRSEAEKLKEAETQKNTKKLPDKKPLQTEKVFLQMPRGMSKEEFDQTRQYLKENGASFDRERKQWYVAPENQEKFEKYLGNPEEKETVKVELLPEAPTGKEKESYIGYIQKVIPQQYTVQLADGESICVRPEKLFEFAAIQNLNPQYVVQLTNGEDLYVRQEKEFEKLIDLLNDAEKKVAEHIEKTWQTAREEGWDMENYQKQFLSGTVWSEKIGEKIDLYLPEYSLSEKGFREITDVQMVSGKLLYADMEKGVYVINGKTGTQVVEGIVYDEKQADIVNKALERNMPAVEIDLIGDSHLSAAQMQQVYESLVTDGLNAYQVAEYANPAWPAWQMNLCRQGMCNGLVFEKVKETIQSCSNYIDGRRFLESEIRAQRNRIIKDIKAHGLVPERQLVRKIEKYNTISGKEHSIDEIVNQEVRGVDSDIGRLQKNVKDEIHRQSMRGRAVLQMQEAAMVMGG